MPRISCCNPFKKENHTYSRNMILLPATEMVINRAKLVLNFDISSSDYICGTCRINLRRKMLTPSEISPPEIELPGVTQPESMSSDSDINEGRMEIEPPFDELEYPNIINKINNFLIPACSPIKKNIRDTSANFKRAKLQKIVDVINKQIFQIPETPQVKYVQRKESRMDQKWLIILKEAFQKQSTYQDKIFFLTTLPPDWTQSKMVKEFQISWAMAQAVSTQIENHGHYTKPSKVSKTKEISPEISNMVRSFFEREDISRCLPGKKDVKSVKEGAARALKQKKLVLCNLTEAFSKFKTDNPNIKIGFTKFCKLRPKECILAGAKGTHSVCVCLIHQNAYLICRAVSKINGPDCKWSTSRNCLQNILCAEPSYSCRISECLECKYKILDFEAELIQLFEEQNVQEIEFFQWQTQDRCRLEKIHKPVDEFIEEFCLNLNKLKLHDFIAEQQADYLKERKSTLLNGEYLVIMDFSENYTFINQDEIQSAHWSKKQTTIFPIVAYYRHDGDIKSICYAIISEDLTHNTVGVHLFQSKFINFLRRSSYPVPEKLIYFTDGAASQFKNKKNFINLCYHQEDFFNVSAEWHFFATSHGKGPSDGVGGTIKREATRHAIRAVNSIAFNDAKDLFIWCKEKITGINFEYSSIDEHRKHAEELSQRFNNLKAIVGTQSFHCFLVSNLEHTVIAKPYSFSHEINFFKMY